MRVGLMIFVLTASVAFGQMTTDSLRSKYGNPLSRETFTVRPGLQVIADYAASGRVCRLQFPASDNVVGEAAPGELTTKMVDEALEEVVPAGVRGKEVNGRTAYLGAFSMLSTEYDHVIIIRPQNFNTPRRGEIVVLFKGELCLDVVVR